MDFDEKAVIQELRQKQVEQERKARFAKPPTEQQKLARIVEDRVMARLTMAGYPVNKTTHKAPFDLWVGGCKVEVKASLYQDKPLRGNRYQACIRNHKADFVILDCINGTDHYFVIPMAAIVRRRTIEITSYDVSQYHGQWAAYLERWDLLYEAVDNAPRQLDLWG